MKQKSISQDKRRLNPAYTALASCICDMSVAAHSGRCAADPVPDFATLPII